MRHLILASCLTFPLLAAQPLEIRFTTPPSTKGETGQGPAGSFGSLENYPSSNWESQAQPVGNGRIGAMVFGNPLKERIQFNDITLWTGGANPSGGYDINEFGAFQNFGDLLLEMEIGQGTPNIANFSRTLDLATGIHSTSWQQDGVTYQREVFASKPDQVIIVRISADKPGKVAGSLSLKGAHGETPAASGGEASFSGKLSNGLRYATAVKVLADGGKVTVQGDRVSWTGNSATLILAATTDYALDASKQFRSGQDPVQTIGRQISSAAAKPYEKLKSAHLTDFQQLMNRVDLDLGAPPEGKSITERLDAYKKGAADPHLEALIYQFGRYLMISTSRDSLPANLQGLWNDSNKPAWYADYHTNINIQMNYWGVETGNLSECAMPLFNWTDAMIPGSREATQKAFGAKTPGWTMRTSVNIFGGNGWQWNLPASAWIAQHYWEHFAFTGDKKFLESNAWPVLHDVSEFWLDHLVEKDGKLVVPKGWSPEHGPREDGVAHDQQIVWDLFTNTLDAAAALAKKDSFVDKVKAAREKLLGPKVGSWGQIMEWTTERPELEKSGHRHTSHLFAVYPGRQISLTGTPDLAKAAAISLEARGTSGDSRRSWTWPWRTAMWARLGRPDKAGEMIRGLFTYNTLANLFATHPPFQIDGNLGIVGGMGEMLVQSHTGEISILPAAAPGWKSGSFRGIRARGGFEIDAAWTDGKLTSGKLASLHGNVATLRIPGNPATLTLKESGNGGRTAKLTAKDGVFRFPTKAGMSYEISL